jgi:hypothetical protein
VQRGGSVRTPRRGGAFDAERVRVDAEEVCDLGVAQQRFGWNASDVQTHTAPVAGFDDGHRQTQLRGANSGHIAPEPAPSTTTSYRMDRPFPLTCLRFWPRTHRGLNGTVRRRHRFGVPEAHLARLSPHSMTKYVLNPGHNWSAGRGSDEGGARNGHVGVRWI